MNRTRSINSKKIKDLRTTNKKEPLSNNTKRLLFTVTALFIAGLLMIFSASAVLAYVRYEDTFFFVKRQLIFIIIGCFLAFLIYKLSALQIRNLAKILLVLTILLLLYLLPNDILKIELPGVVTLNGATRWIRIPGLFDIQPSEIAKIAIILFTSLWITRSNKTKQKHEKWINSKKNNEYYYYFLKFCYSIFPIIVMGIVALFILLQRDLDTIVIIALSFFCIYYAASKSKKESRFILIILIVSVILGLGASILEPYRRQRVESYLEILVKGEPENKQGASFQIWNGLIAIGSGGLFGVGYGESRQKLFFLQEAAYTDSIYAVFAEEFGLFGTFILVFGYFYLMAIGLSIAKTAQNKFMSLVAIGITSYICIQSFLNIAANLSIIPFGGMPLPFFTYGGSSTITLLIGIGLLLNASKGKE